MSVYKESNIEFDFTQAKTANRHNNSVWKGVDFCIEEPSGEWIWLEVKSWDLKHIDPHRRGGAVRSFRAKMKSNDYANEMCGKFIGTTAFLAWKGNFVLAPTTFVLLFEPPRPLDAALLGSRITRMQSLIPRKIWAQPLGVVVLTTGGWNERFPDYPAKAR